MSGVAIALLASLGAGTWIYTKMMRSTGGITQNALIVAGTSAFIIFLFLVITIKMIAD